MRNVQFVAGNFYHVYAHAISNLALFRVNGDYNRFLLALFSANGEDSVAHLDRHDGLNLVLDIRDGKIKIGDPLVDVVCFCLMPNHFHLILRERSDGNISRFMHKISVSYAKYLNLKYERRGHVFESSFHSRLLDTNNYLLRASCYVHLNPKDLRGWNKKEHKYPWSSFRDFVDDNRWGSLLQTDAIADQFGSKREYENFVGSARTDFVGLLSET